MKKMLPRFIRFGFFAVFCVLLQPLQATELSKQLSDIEVKRAGSILGFSSLHRAWTAHALPSSSLGVDLGIETAFIARRDLLTQGDASAVIPRIVPVPRVWLAWDMPFDLTWSLSFAPGFLFNGVSSYGTAMQWYVLEIPEINSSVSLLAHYTYADAFSDLKSSTLGLSAQISRDLGSWQPYAAVGLVSGNFKVDDSVAVSSAAAGPHTVLRSHIYAGTRLDFATKLSFQFDLIGTELSWGMLFSDTF